ncbi:MAG TPA: hypothetical protein PKE12_09955 [Kiritimatiellia bacterium]|nr:hypothetical protein [Kiritimatiellia bacterium]
MRIFPAIVAVLLCLALDARAQEVRLLNGTVAKGEVVSVKAEGMELKAGGTTRLYPWSALSHGTRYRFDPLYRSNFAFAQQGRPADQWTNAPDGEYSVKPADLLPKAAAASTPAADARLALGAFPAHPARPRASMVELEAAAGDRSLSWGFRFGPEELDAAYFIFEPTGARGLPEGGSLWTSPDKRVERVRGSRRADGADAVMNYRRQAFKGTVDSAEAQYGVSLTAATRHPDTLFLALDVDLKKDKDAASFTLLGTPPGLLVGDGEVSAQDLLMPPDLFVRIMPVEEKPTLVGYLRMGRLLLLPRAGMDKAVHVTVVDASNKTVVDHKAQIIEDSPLTRESFAIPAEGLVSGQSYIIRARINLGALLGVVEYEATYTAP